MDSTHRAVKIKKKLTRQTMRNAIKSDQGYKFVLTGKFPSVSNINTFFLLIGYLEELSSGLRFFSLQTFSFRLVL